MSEQPQQKLPTVIDIEVGPNYFMVGLHELDSDVQIKYLFFIESNIVYSRFTQKLCNPKRRLYVETHFPKYSNSECYLQQLKLELQKIKWIVTFNGNYYDDYIIEILLDFKFTRPIVNNDIIKLISKIYQTSVDIIEKKIFPEIPARRSIDLKKVARTEKSLKMIGGTLNYPIVMDFPVDPHKRLDIKEISTIWCYLSYDLEITSLFYMSLRPEIQLRKRISTKYNLSVMHEDRPGIADILFKNLYSQASGLSTFELTKKKYDLRSTSRVKIGNVVSNTVKFTTQPLIDFFQDISNLIIDCSGEKITINIPEIQINNTVYQMGAGGLHSKDEPGLFLSDKNFTYKDADVSSYYPRLIVTNKLYPKHLGPLFYSIVEQIMLDRLAAKKAGNTVDAETMKIVVNSIFGRSGDKHSWYYSPEVFLGTTINGQLYLLMLIEQLELNGIEVISANTDGITSKIPAGKEALYDQICAQWMQDTQMELEFAKYDLYARLSVGSYLAVTDKGKIKTKNEFNYENTLDKAANAIVIPKVLIEYLVGTYLKHQTLSIQHMVKMYLSQPNTSIYDFMWTQKPMTSDWRNVAITPNNVIPISKTVRHLVCKNSYPHKVKLVKEHVSQKGKKGIPKRTAYVAGEYSALTSDMLKLNNLNIPLEKFIKFDYYINDIEEKLRLITTKKKSGNLTLFST